MNTRNAVLGVVAVGLIGTGLWWMNQPAPAPTADKPAAVATPAASAPKVAMPVAPKAAVAAPVMAPVTPAATPKIVNTTAVPDVDPQLNAAVSDFIVVLESKDANRIVQDFIAPGIMDSAKAAAAAQFATMSPEERAVAERVMEQQMQTRMPQLLEQMTQQIFQDPRTMDQMQKMADALKQAQATSAPQMNETGDQATYTIDNSADKNMPATITMSRHDGKWSLDIMKMSAASRANRNGQ